ncbi:MAG: ATP-dependent DNA ligase [Candidatus Pacearchaeota archaeon]|nr:ATP-dependent DNA ligase [Candidatus Pacearchaeota archaeon]
MLYKELVKVYQGLEATQKRLEKTYILAEFFKSIDEKEARDIAYLVQGKVFPDWQEAEIGVSSQLAIKAISKATGMNEEEIIKEWRKLGDLGKVTEEATKKRKQKTLFATKLTTEKVIENLRKASSLQGSGTIERKIALVAELITLAEPIEARYVVRTLLEELRIGVAEGTIRDAIVWACFGDKIGIKYNKEEGELELKEEQREEYNKYIELVQQAYDLANDFGIVLEAARKGENALKSINLEPGRPVKVELCLKVDSIKEAFESVGRPAKIELKYDGFRMLIHKTEKGKIILYTRRLDNITNQFPEVVDFVAKHVEGKSFILDAEAVGYDPKTKRYRPFQEISQRIKRKYEIEKMQKDLPVEVNIFDCLFYNGKSLIKEPLKERQKLLEKIIKPVKWKIKIAEGIITDKEEEAEKFYTEALKKGMEGIIMKNLNSHYQPGARVGTWVKFKPTQEPLDLVIVGAEWGTGKRSGWLSSFILACRHEDKFLEVGKVGTGVKEKSEGGVSFEELTKILKPLIIEQKGREVKIKPKVVVEVAYQEIQKSPTYSSGFALRFPRILRLRPEHGVFDIHTLTEIEQFYTNQFKKKKIK